jgi:hypothetical protein
MIKRDWSKFLHGQYVSLRNSPQWEDIKSQHEEEDQNYFEMLESKNIKTLPWPNDGRMIYKWDDKK